MSYQSPIELFQTDPFIQHLRGETDNMIYRAVVHANVNVDREELIKALEYDRGQYEKGYADGLAYKPPIDTKADRIRAMSDEELAAWFIKIQDDTADYIDGQYSRNLPATSESWALWLKSPADKEERH